jgi:hypothetical protein
MSIASRTPIDPPSEPAGKSKTARTKDQHQGSADGLLIQVENQMGESWLPRIYRDRILKLRTRSYVFPSLARQSAPVIQHTLLGIELKVGRQRMICPDLATARYLAVFARAGCEAIAIPYDITRISHVADELESSWHRMLLLSDSLAGNHGEAFAARIRRLLIGRVRDEVAAAGAGTRIPEFKQSTRQVDRPQKGNSSTSENE